jgi:PAS domain S-box-containing protein
MAEPASRSDLAFLAGGGEMGAMVRGFDWTATALGVPARWPQALKTTVQIMLNTRHPMFMFWGAELTFLYNDAFSRTLGPEQHPGGLGQPARQVMDEIWEIIAPQIEQVMTGQGATWHENHRIPVTRHGQTDYIWWTYSFSPIHDEASPHGTGGVLAVCNDVTGEQLARERLKAREMQLAQFIQHAPVSIAMFDREMRYVAVSQSYCNHYGVPEQNLVGQLHYEAFPDIPPRWRDVHVRCLAGAIERLERDSFERTDGTVDWTRWEVQPWYDGDGAIGGIILFSEVITERVEAQRRQDFLLRLADHLQAEPHEAMTRASEALGIYLGVSKAGFAEAADTGESITITHEYSDGTLGSALGKHHLPDFGPETLEELATGRIVVIYDRTTDPRTVSGIKTHQSGASRALLVVPLVREGQLRALLYLAHREPRIWTKAEISLAEEVGARSWVVVEQARAETVLQQAAEDFRTLANNIPALCWMAAPDGTAVWQNQRWFDYTGMTPEEALGHGWHSVIPEDVLPSAMERWEAARKAGTDYEMTIPIRRADGQFRLFLTRATPVRTADGHITRWFGTQTDITEAIEREEALRRSEAQFRAVAEALPGLLFITTAQGENVYVNQGYCQHTGRTAEELLGRRWMDVAHPEDLAGMLEHFNRAVERNGPFEAECRFRRYDGAWRWHMVRALPSQDTGSSAKRWAGVCLDIHDRTMLEEELQTATRRFELALKTSTVILFCQDLDLRYTWMHNLALGDNAEQLIGKDENAIFTRKEDVVALQTLKREVMQSGIGTRQEITLYHQGAELCYDLIADPLLGQDGKVAGIACAAIDITERKRAENEARAISDALQTVLMSITDGLLVLDRDWRFTFFNEQGARMIGMRPEELVGHNVWALFPHAEGTAFHTEFHRAVETRQSIHFEEYYPEPLNKWLECHCYPGANNLSVYFRDITDRKLIETSLQHLTMELEKRVREEIAAREAAQARAAHAERMQALGQLAGGIAHDLNNVLQAVQGGALLINKRAQGREDIQRLTKMVVEATERGAAVTNRLLSFARRGDLRAEPVNVTELLTELQNILSHTLGTDLVVKVAVPPGLAQLLADKGQLETVLVNLASNARDAMPNGGTLTLSAEAVSTQGTGTYPAELAPGHYIRLRLSDTGVGMDKATLARATEPFFTTKSVGKGTGLGLAMARGFAEQSRGALVVESIEGQGTTILLWLPEASGAAQSEARPEIVLDGDASGHVLLVDDETLVRDTLAEQIEEAGFKVITAANAGDALGYLGAEMNINILVTDLTMPGGMDGLALVREAQARRPGLPAILLTGYAGSGTGTELALSGVIGGRLSLLRKPVSGALLVDHINALLVAQAPSKTGAQ